MTFDLNRAQQRVAQTLSGGVLVTAGAGTGKTRALTERFVRSVRPLDPGGEPVARVDRVLTITFTDKAAGEIAERIRRELKASGHREELELLEGAWISTIHGFGRRLLRRHALEAGLDPSFALADDVVAGFVAAEALEHTLRRSMDRCDAERGILESYRLEDVVGAIRHLAQALRSRGLDAGALVAEPVEEPTALVREAVAALERASSGFTCPGAGAGAIANREACGSALAELSSIDTSSQLASEVGAAVWRAVSVGWPRKATAAAVREAAGKLQESRQDIARRAAALITAPLAAELKETVDEFLRTAEALKEERGLLDFDDLQIRTRELLAADIELRDRYRRMFELVMVDEFQDTDELQLRIVEAVAEENLCTVGDERQSIYAFRGADIEVYRRHRETMRRKGALEVELVENYRSHPEIIAFVNGLFRAGVLFGSGHPSLVSGRGPRQEARAFAPGPRVRAEVVTYEGNPGADAWQSEAEVLADRLAELRSQGVPSHDMVVLVRQYRRATPVAEALQKRGFNVEVVGGSRFFGLRETATLKAACAAIANPLDDIALARVLVSDLSAISDEGIWLLSDTVSREEGRPSLWDALSRADSVLDGRDRDAAAHIREGVASAIERAAAESLFGAVAGLIEECGLDLLYAASGREGEQAFENVQKFLRKIQSFERSGESGAAAFVARLDAEERFGSTESPAPVVSQDSSAVRIMSIHQSKGLEFPVVAIPFCGEGSRSPVGIVRSEAEEGRLRLALALPGYLGDMLGASHKEALGRTEGFSRLDGRTRERGRDELKRQFYVACTRAEDILLLTGSMNGAKTVEDMPDSPLAWFMTAFPGAGGASAGEPLDLALEDGHAVRVNVSAASSNEAHPPAANEEPPVAEECAGSVPACPLPPSDPVAAPLRVAEGVPPTCPDQLSATDIGLHARCPLRYWAERVAGFRRGSRGAGTGALEFGSALHAVLQLDRAGSNAVDDARVGAIARRFQLDPGGITRLASATGAWYSSVARERLQAHQRVWTEYPFTVLLDNEQTSPFELVGVVDAWGRSGADAFVVDYKSGRPAADDAGSRERYGTQAAVYAYAALRAGCETVEVTFVHPETGKAGGELLEVGFSFTVDDAGSIETDLARAHSRIAREPYRPRAGWEPDPCSSCPISGTVCPVVAPGRAAG